MSTVSNTGTAPLPPLPRRWSDLPRPYYPPPRFLVPMVTTEDIVKSLAADHDVTPQQLIRAYATVERTGVAIETALQEDAIVQRVNFALDGRRGRTDDEDTETTR